MLNKKRFFMLVLSASILATLIASNAWAITSITSTLVPTTYSVEGYNIPILRINKGDTFSFNLTAVNPVGEITWNILYTENPSSQNNINTTPVTDDSITISATKGNTVTVNGTLSNDTGYSVSVIATDASAGIENIMTQYVFWVQNIDDNQSNSTEMGLVTDPTNPNSENNAITSPDKLHVSMVESVPEEYRTEDLLQKLADNVSTDRSNIRWLPADAIGTSEPPEPTQSMKDKVAKDRYQFAAKLNTIKVSEDGYYVFQVTVSDDLVGMKVSDLKLYYAEDSDFTTSSVNRVKLAFGPMPIINGVTGGFEISNFFGVKLDTLPKQFLATMFLSASKSITVYIVKILIALLLGGCNVGFGIIGISVGGFLIWRLYKRHS